MPIAPSHTWYLSQVPQVVPVEKKSVMWRKFRFLHICHVEKSEIAPHPSCGENSDLSTWQMWRIGVVSTWWMWSNFTFLHMTDVENMSCLHMTADENMSFLHMVDVEKFHHLLIYQINNVYNLRCFYVYYAVLLQNLFILRFTLFCRKICFCRDLRAFAWRKIEPKIVTVEKKGQISCMIVTE